MNGSLRAPKARAKKNLEVFWESDTKNAKVSLKSIGKSIIGKCFTYKEIYIEVKNSEIYKQIYSEKTFREIGNLKSISQIYTRTPHLTLVDDSF